jgi:hydrogenase maturation protein HypF
VVADVDAGASASAIAIRFHRALAEAVATVSERVRARGGPSVVALGGGVFVNAVLVTACEERLLARGFTVLRPTRVPPNAGGLALGQILIAASA